MSQTDDIRRLLLRELAAFRREIALFPDDDAIWATMPGVANSAGNLALHVAGNLEYFVGRCVGGRNYLRDRPAEFSTRGLSRQEVDVVLARVVGTVTTVLAAGSDAALQEPMAGAPNGMQARTGMFLLHLVAHTAFHLGQAGYLRRVLTGEQAVSAGPLPLDVLADA